MIEPAWRTALYYVLLFFRRPVTALLPALLIFGAGTYAIMIMQRPFYSEGLLVMNFQQIPSSLVSPTVANDRLRFVEQRVLSRDNLVSLAERFSLYPDLPPSATAASIAALVRDSITLRTTFSDGSDGLASASVVLGFEHTTAAKAVDVSTELIRMVIDENHRLRIAQASETTQFLRREVEDLANRLKLREADWALSGEHDADVQPTRLPTMLIELQGREDDLSTAEQAVVASQEEIRLLESQLQVGLQAQSLPARLEAELAALATEIAEGKLVFTDEHPQIRLLEQKARNLRSAYENAVAHKSTGAPEPVASLPPDLALLRDRLNQARPRYEAAIALRTDLQGKITQLKAAIAQATEAAATLSDIEEEREALQRNLDEMKGRLSTALMGERLELKNAAFQVDVLEKPAFPIHPSGPRRLLLLVGLIIVSAGAGLASLIATDIMDSRVRGTFDLAHALEGQTLVLLPSWTPRRPNRSTLRRIAASNPS